MNLRRILPALAVLTLATASPLFAAPENAALFKGDDPRLEQKLNCKAEGIPVAQLLSELTASSGIEMNAGLDKDDWMVRDRKVIVYARDIKLKDLMQEVAKVLRFHWSRGGEQGKWTYRLWQDTQQRAEEERLRTAEDDERAKQFRERRENALADMVNLGSLSQADSEGLKSSDPWRYVLATEPLGKDVAEFLNSFQDARGSFLAGTEASFPVSQLPPPLQDTVRRIAESYDALTKSIGVSEDQSDLLASFERLQVTINRTSATQNELLSKNLLGRITIGSGLRSFDIPLFAPGSSVGRAMGRAILGLRSGKSKEAVGKGLETEMQAALKETQVSQQATRDISSDPALRAKVELFAKPTIAPLPVTLRLLAEKAGTNVFSDCFAESLPTIASGERTLGQQLESIASAYAVNWVKEGRTVRFGDREWYKKRAWDVPQVWMDYWTRRGKQNNGLQLMDLAQVGSLRDEQIDHTIMKDPELVRLGAGDAARNREILRFYGMLSENQRSQIAGGKLGVGSLDETQWNALQRALATKGAAYAAADKGSQTIQLSQSGHETVDYRFSYYPGGSDAAVVFKLQTGVVLRTGEGLPPPPKDP